MTTGDVAEGAAMNHAHSGEARTDDSNSGGSSALPGSHGLCGDLGSRNGFTAGGEYGPTKPRGTFVANGLMDVTVRLTAYHAGWFEFRLAVPADGGADMLVPITQSLLNEHVRLGTCSGLTPSSSCCTPLQPQCRGRTLSRQSTKPAKSRSAS